MRDIDGSQYDARLTLPVIFPAKDCDSWIACLCSLRAQLALAGEEPRDYQKNIMADLEAGLCEHALGRMNEWWCYDQEALFQRGGGRPAKPRIIVGVRLTSKGNLVVEWSPTGKDGDWGETWRLRCEPGYRPSNELLFIRGVEQSASWYLRHMSLEVERNAHERIYALLGSGIDATLLVAVASRVRQLKARLEHLFEVRMISDIYMSWTTATRNSWLSCQLSDWRIESIDERTLRLETDELDEFLANVPVDAVDAAVEAATTKKRTGPPPKNSTSDDRVSRELRRAGFELTPKAVGRYRELLRKYRPESLPDWERAAPPAEPRSPSAHHFR